jgi:hypothetical protein
VRNDCGDRNLFGAPYFGIHRADNARGPAELHLGHRLVDLIEEGDRLGVTEWT